MFQFQKVAQSSWFRFLESSIFFLVDLHKSRSEKLLLVNVLSVTDMHFAKIIYCYIKIKYDYEGFGEFYFAYLLSPLRKAWSLFLLLRMRLFENIPMLGVGKTSQVETT